MLGIVAGPPPPTDPAVPDDVEAGFPGPCVRCSSTSRVPKSQSWTKPPMLGLAMFHSEKLIGQMGQHSSIPDPIRTPVDREARNFVVHVHVDLTHRGVAQCSTTPSSRDHPELGWRSRGLVSVAVAKLSWLTFVARAVKVHRHVALVTDDTRHVDRERPLGDGRT